MSFIAANKVYTSTNKTIIVWIETELSSFFFFLPWVDASRVYVRAWALGCFYSHISTRTFRRALTASVDSCAEIKSAPTDSGVTRSGRVWRKVPESDARSVLRLMCLSRSDSSARFNLVSLRSPGKLLLQSAMVLSRLKEGGTLTLASPTTCLKERVLYWLRNPEVVYWWVCRLKSVFVLVCSLWPE